MKYIFSSKGKGFTLIELLVVIAVIGMLASIVLVSLGPVRVKARDARRQVDIKTIETAMELYFQSQDPETYLDISNTAIAIPANSSIGTLLTSVPLDPTNADPYQYKWSDAGTPKTTYCVWARLELPTTATYLLARPGGILQTTTAPTGLGTNCTTAAP